MEIASNVGLPLSELILNQKPDSLVLDRGTCKGSSKVPCVLRCHHFFSLVAVGGTPPEDGRGSALRLPLE